MKQHITKRQWDELDKEKQKIILDWLLKKELGLSYLNVKFGDKYYFNIGHMIEFLGDDLDSIENMQSSYLIYDNAPEDRNQYEEKELCDALWELCKIKIKERSKK